MDITGDDATQTKEALVQYIDEYAKEGSKSGLANDSSAGLAATLIILKTLATGKEIDESAIAKLSASIQKSMDLPAVRSASDAQKQEAYDYAVAAGGMVLILAQAVKGDDASAKLAQMADVFSLLLVKAPIAKVKVSGTTITLEGSKPASNPGAGNTGAVAANFSSSMPANWVQDGVWSVIRFKERPDDSAIISAMVRFLPAVVKSKNGGVILAELWKTAVPAEIPMGSMIYRRYVGDRVPAWFVTGKAKEKGRLADSFFTLMIVDCGKTWQPVVVAQTYEETSQFTAGVEMSASFSYGRSAELAEQMLSTFRCAETAGTPLADRSAIAGTLHFGSAASMDYIHIPTGTTSTSYVTYGGSYTFAANGTFTYSYSSASSNGGGANFGKVDGKGTWTIEGDKLVAKFSEYKQWTSSGGFPSELKNKVYVYLIGGVTTYGDGTKVVILVETPPVKTINAVTVGDRSNWYSTKKKD